jgi:P-type conjugative transfer protein TrbJ
MKKSLLTVIAILFASLTSVAHAQWAVFDAGNFSQNILTAGRTLQTVQNQISQLQNEAQMLTNEARNLQSLNFNSLSQILNLLNTTNRLISQAQGMPFNVTSVNAQFTRYYPQSYLPSTSANQMASDAQTRWTYSLAALQTSMRLQAQAAQNAASDQSTLSSLVSQSQSAGGALQASQATNQLIALETRQAMQEQQLRLTQDRAAALEQARAVAAEARALVVRAQFIGSGTQYTPQSVSFYGN